MGGLLALVFLKKFAQPPPYPIKDPRLIEAMGLYHPVPTQISGGELDQCDDLPDASAAFGGRETMNIESARQTGALAYLLAIVGSFLIIGALAFGQCIVTLSRRRWLKTGRPFAPKLWRDPRR